jgi:hemolysin III
MVSRPLIAQGYSLAEEVANSISHGIGLVFGIVGLVLLLVQAVDANASAMAITSYSLYGGSMILLFLASTLYHAIPHQRAKMWLKKFDHCAIYLLIAGTYTPFLLVGLNSPLSRGLMIVIWSLALLGILFKLTIAHRFKVLSLVTYLTMGWLSLIVVYLAIKLSVGGVTLLALGGVVYSLGVIFYVCKRIPYNHAIWHGFVLGGSVCHFWRFICTWGRCVFPRVGGCPHPALPQGEERSAGRYASLFQRIRQRLDAQRVRIVTHAEHAVGFHVVVHDGLHQKTSIIQLYGG